MGDYLWIAVTPDEYELPLAVANSSWELGRMMGVKGNVIRRQFNNHQRGKLKKWTKYKIVKVVDEDG